MTVSEITCAACGERMIPRIAPWSYRCVNKHAWASTFEVSINDDVSRIDEGFREAGLETIRAENNVRVLDTLEKIAPLSGARLLDVGSAHGWFLSAAVDRGAVVTGIEPDELIASQSQHGDSVRPGFFPDVVAAEETFDVISFNDVLEHIPDPADAVEACFRHLAPGGRLSINIPDNRGLAFTLARLGARLGATGPYERLWQKGLPSPHLWYFNADSLALLGRHAGFTTAATRRLPSLSGTSLWQRVHMDRQPTMATRFQFAAVALLRPLFNMRAFSDILHIVLVKPET